MNEKSIEDSETWDAQISFKGSCYVSGRPFICEDGSDGTIPHLVGGFIGFDLSPHTTNEEARDLLAMMNRHITHLTFTGPVRPEFIDSPGRAAIAKRSRRRKV
jgi:hypothetical protein